MVQIEPSLATDNEYEVGLASYTEVSIIIYLKKFF